MNKEIKFHFFSFSLGVLFSLQCLFVLCFFTDISFAEMPEGIEIVQLVNGCESGKSLVDTIVRAGGVASEGDCCQAGTDFSNAILADTKYTGGSCYAGYGPVNPPCTVMLITVCCDSSWALALGKKTDGVGAAGTIIDVPVGNEKTVAENLYSQFDTEYPYPDHTSDELIRTDGVKGFMYQVGIGADDSTSSVSVEMWKVGGYAPVGQVTSVEGVGEGGGSSGGLSKADTTDAVHDALTGVGLTNAQVRQSMDDAWDRAHGLGYMSGVIVSGDYYNDGLSLVDTQTAVKNALETAGVGYVDSSDSYSGSLSSADPYNSAYTNEAFNSTNAPTLASSWSAFKSDVADAPIMGLADGFFSGVPTSAAPELVEFNAGVFGQHSFNFSTLAPAMTILRGVILVIFSFIAVKVVVLKGGGG